MYNAFNDIQGNSIVIFLLEIMIFFHIKVTWRMVEKVSFISMCLSMWLILVFEIFAGHSSGLLRAFITVKPFPKAILMLLLVQTLWIFQTYCLFGFFFVLTLQFLKIPILYWRNTALSKDSTMINVNHKHSVSEINNPFNNAEKLVKWLLKKSQVWWEILITVQM